VTATAPQRTPATRTGRGARIGWTVAASVFAAFAVVSVANMQSGMQGNPRTTNPNPGPAPYPPFLGVTNWPVVMSTVAVLLTIGFSERPRGSHSVSGVCTGR